MVRLRLEPGPIVTGIAGALASWPPAAERRGNALLVSAITLLIAIGT